MRRRVLAAVPEDVRGAGAGGPRREEAAAGDPPAARAGAQQPAQAAGDAALHARARRPEARRES